jgi:hypothetical protein
MLRPRLGRAKVISARAIYFASGAFTIYALAKAAGRSPGRLHENIRLLLEVLRGGGS